MKRNNPKDTGSSQKKAAQNTEQLANRAFEAIKDDNANGIYSLIASQKTIEANCPGIFDADVFVANSLKSGMFTEAMIAKSGGKEVFEAHLKDLHAEKYAKHHDTMSEAAQRKAATNMLGECLAAGDFKTGKFIGITGGKASDNSKLKVLCPEAQSLETVEVKVDLAGKMTLIRLASAVKFGDDLWVMKVPYCEPAELFETE